MPGPALLPAGFKWLGQELGPEHLTAVLSVYGLQETPGSADNPQLMAMMREAGFKDYAHDSIAWCAGLLSWAEIQAGRPGPHTLSSQAFKKYGVGVDAAKLADILVWEHLDKPGFGHVGLYVGETPSHYASLGGNQGDAVCVRFYTRSKKRAGKSDMVLRAIRRPPYNIVPVNVRVIQVHEDGALIGGGTR